MHWYDIVALVWCVAGVLTFIYAGLRDGLYGVNTLDFVASVIIWPYILWCQFRPR